MITDPTSLAPYGVLAGAGHEGKEMLYDSLVQWDKDLKVVPALAESWATPDDKTYTFKLKQGIKFHSGKEMDAEDVKYSLENQRCTRWAIFSQGEATTTAVGCFSTVSFAKEGPERQTR